MMKSVSSGVGVVRSGWTRLSGQDWGFCRLQACGTQPELQRAAHRVFAGSESCTQLWCCNSTRRRGGRSAPRHPGSQVFLISWYLNHPHWPSASTSWSSRTRRGSMTPSLTSSSQSAGFSQGTRLSFVKRHEYETVSQVRNVMMGSKLPMSMLGKIWDLAYQDKDGSLDRFEDFSPHFSE